MQENKLEMKDFVPNLLRRTEIPCMRMKLVDTTPEIAESKFGGRGYVPHDAAIPTNSEGVQMRLLAQIDCRQITIPDFPTSGLLQFWAINDDLTGCDFDNNTEQKDFRICYYETVDPTVTEEEVAAKEGNNLPCEEDLFPIEGCFGLKFEQTTDRMSMSDYRFWEKIEQFNQERGSWKTWLTAITRNAALNYTRDTHRHNSVEEIPDDIPSSEPSPEELIIQKERQSAVNYALRQLSPKDRMLFYRKYYYLQSTAQIASELGMTERSVEGKLYRLKKQLRKMLGGEVHE